MQRDRRPIARMYRAANLEAALIHASYTLKNMECPGDHRYNGLLALAWVLDSRADRVRRWIDAQLQGRGDA